MSQSIRKQQRSDKNTALNSINCIEKSYVIIGSQFFYLALSSQSKSKICQAERFVTWIALVLVRT